MKRSRRVDPSTVPRGRHDEPVPGPFSESQGAADALGIPRVGAGQCGGRIADGHARDGQRPAAADADLRHGRPASLRCPGGRPVLRGRSGHANAAGRDRAFRRGRLRERRGLAPAESATSSAKTMAITGASRGKPGCRQNALKLDVALLRRGQERLQDLLHPLPWRDRHGQGDDRRQYGMVGRREHHRRAPQVDARRRVLQRDLQRKGRMMAIRAADQGPGPLGNRRLCSRVDAKPETRTVAGCPRLEAGGVQTMSDASTPTDEPVSIPRCKGRALVGAFLALAMAAGSSTLDRGGIGLPEIGRLARAATVWPASYLVGLMFVTSVSVGALAWVMLHHLTAARLVGRPPAACSGQPREATRLDRRSSSFPSRLNLDRHLPMGRPVAASPRTPPWHARPSGSTRARVQPPVGGVCLRILGRDPSGLLAGASARQDHVRRILLRGRR